MITCPAVEFFKIIDYPRLPKWARLDRKGAWSLDALDYTEWQNISLTAKFLSLFPVFITLQSIFLLINDKTNKPTVHPEF